MLPDVAQELDVAEPAQPVCVVEEKGASLAAVEIEEPGYLRADGLDVVVQLVFREQVPLVAFPRGVADHAGPAAGDGDRTMAGVLETPKRHQPDEMSDVKRRRAGIDPEIEGDRVFAQARGQGVIPGPLVREPSPAKVLEKVHIERQRISGFAGLHRPARLVPAPCRTG